MTSRTRFPILLASLASLVACAERPPEPAPSPPPQTVWRLDSLDSVGGRRPTVLGRPAVVGEGDERAVEFDGVDDGLEVALHPLAGAGSFTVEAVFRPAAGGEREQRFLHLQEDASEDRILLEIRVTPDGESWFLDTYVKTRDEGHTLFAKSHEHPLGPWYHAALVVDSGRMTHWVDGRRELSRSIDYRPQGPGRTSIGVRINRVSWFKGAIREIRFTPRALTPDEFLQH